MNALIRHPALRRALAIGAVAGASIALSAWTLDADPPSPEGSTPAFLAPAQAEADRIRLAQADDAPEYTRVSYASDQADRGEERFDRDCVECHGDDLRGGMNGGAPLRGLAFEQKFANGAPASGLYLYMSTLMPPDSPGRFSESQYADLMAYILKRNGFQPGAPLPSDLDALDYMLIEK